MAEALDTYSDLDMSDSDTEGDGRNLDKEFNLAADYVKKLAGKLETDKLLEIYGLFKQATEGACNIPRPTFFEMQAKKKWEVWNALGDLPSEKAKENYIQIINELDPGWNDKTPKSKMSGIKQTSHWAAVSSLYSNDDNIEEKDKTIYDFCKEGNIFKVQSMAESHPDQLNKIDKDGLGLIHWAADRGFCDMLKLLINLHCNVSLKDDMGQTALHYAASCGHTDCVDFLLKCGADKSSKDDEGLTPLDVANDDSIKHLLF